MFLTNIFDSENQDFRPYPYNTRQYNIWDIIRGCRWPSFHKMEIKNIELTFDHNLYYIPYSLSEVHHKYTPYTCNTKTVSSVSDKCTLYMGATSKLNCLCFMAIKLT